MQPFPMASEGSCFTSRMMDALFYSMAVYEPTLEAVLTDLHSRFGNVSPLMEYGFDKDGKQAIFAARSSEGHIIVACRGTVGVKDVLQDLKYFHTRLAYARGAAHWGFAERAQSVPIDLFCKLLSAGEQIVFTGHSLGGAVASLLSLRVLEQSKGMYQQQVQCITFGSPLFASQSLAEVINASYKDVFIHVVSKRDCVPKILPVVSAIQRLLYASEDHLKGLSVLTKWLECIKWLPVAPLIRGIERRIPSPLKFLLRCLMKLALPSHVTGSYAFAGHVLMLDSDATIESSLKLTSADDLNLWHSQLSFALGTGFDASMIQEHAMASYHDGIVRAFSHVFLNHKVSSSGLCVEASSLLLEEKRECYSGLSCKSHAVGNQDIQWRSWEDGSRESLVEHKKSILIRMTTKEGDWKEVRFVGCEVCGVGQQLVAKEVSATTSLQDIDVWQKDQDEGKELLNLFKFVQQSGSGITRGDGIDSRSVHFNEIFQFKFCSFIFSSGSSLELHDSMEDISSASSAEIDRSGKWISKSRRSLDSGLVCCSDEDNEVSSVGYATVTLSSMTNVGCCAASQSLICASSIKTATDCTCFHWDSTYTKRLPGKKHGSDAILLRSMTFTGDFGWPACPRMEGKHLLRCQTKVSNCRACPSLEVCKHFNGRKAAGKAPSKEARRSQFKFGLFVGTIGRVAGHLCALDNICLFTFIRIVLSSILG